MDEASLVTEGTVGTHQNLLCHRLTEHLHLQGVGEDLLRFLTRTEDRGVTPEPETSDESPGPPSHPVQVRVDQSHVVVAGDDVPQRREPLLHPLDPHGVRQRVPDVLQLLVRGVVGDQEAVAVT